MTAYTLNSHMGLHVPQQCKQRASTNLLLNLPADSKHPDNAVKLGTHEWGASSCLSQRHTMLFQDCAYRLVDAASVERHSYGHLADQLSTALEADHGPAGVELVNQPCTLIQTQVGSQRAALACFADVVNAAAAYMLLLDHCVTTAACEQHHLLELYHQLGHGVCRSRASHSDAGQYYTLDLL